MDMREDSGERKPKEQWRKKRKNERKQNRETPLKWLKSCYYGKKQYSIWKKGERTKERWKKVFRKRVDTEKMVWLKTTASYNLLASMCKRGFIVNTDNRKNSIKN